MNLVPIRNALFLVVFFSTYTFSQDKIYLTTSTKQGKIVSISSATVSYRPTLDKTQTINIPLSSIVLLFNEKGSFLAPGALNFEDGKTKQAIQTFLNQTSSLVPADRVYGIDGSRLEGKITDEDDSYVQILAGNATRKIPKSAITAIIYKDGRHAIVSAIDAAIDVLVKNEGAAPGFRSSSAAIAQKQAPPPAPENTNTVQQTAATVSAPESGGDMVKPNIEEMLGGVSKAAFEEKATQKTKQFSTYLKILCDKSNATDDMNKVIDQAVALFVNENATVEISSANRENTRRRKIKQYLIEVKQLPYDKIELEWTNVQYVSDVRLAPDGTYRGNVTFEQTFSGYRDGQLAYKDVTKKSAEVVLKTYTKSIEGVQVANWDILLSDIGVSWTQKGQNQ